jgi:hypothetical protein
MREGQKAVRLFTDLDFGDMQAFDIARRKAGGPEIRYANDASCFSRRTNIAAFAARSACAGVARRPNLTAQPLRTGIAAFSTQSGRTLLALRSHRTARPAIARKPLFAALSTFSGIALGADNLTDINLGAGAENQDAVPIGVYARTHERDGVFPVPAITTVFARLALRPGFTDRTLRAGFSAVACGSWFALRTCRTGIALCARIALCASGSLFPSHAAFTGLSARALCTLDTRQTIATVARRGSRFQRKHAPYERFDGVCQCEKRGLLPWSGRRLRRAGERNDNGLRHALLPCSAGD